MGQTSHAMMEGFADLTQAWDKSEGEYKILASIPQPYTKSVVTVDV